MFEDMFFLFCLLSREAANFHHLKSDGATRLDGLGESFYRPGDLQYSMKND